MSRQGSPPPPIRVVHVHSTPSAIGGSEMSLHLSLDALHRRGVRSSLICAEAPAARDIPRLETMAALPEVFSEAPASPLRVRRLARVLVAAVSQAQADVVHVRLGLRAELVEHLARYWPVVYSAHLPVCPNGARYLHRDEAVCTARVGMQCVTSGYRTHGCGHLADGTGVSLPAFGRALRSAKRLLQALCACKQVIASSRWQAERLAGDGVSSDKIAVLHPPIIPCRPVSTGGPPIVAFAGRLVGFKGVHHLLRVSREIRAHHRVWIIGDGPQRRLLEGMAEGLDVAERVRFWGTLAPAEALRVLGCAHVVAVPSLWGETFNQVGAQAAAGGQKVVGYDVGGMRDWAERYRNAVLIPAGNQCALADTLAHALATPNRASQPVNYFSIERHINALTTIYQNSLSHANGRY